MTVFASPASTFSPRIKIKDGTSTNWSGYAIQTSLSTPQSNAVSSVKGNWIVPSVDCSGTPTAYSSFWIGIDGYSSSTVEQIGTDSDCSNGIPKYYAWYEMYPKFPANLRMKVSPGNLMSAEITFGSKNTFTLKITNTSTGETFTTNQKSNNVKRSSAEWIAEAPSSSGGVLPLANFGTAIFQNSSATVNGTTGTISNPAWQYDVITMKTSSGTTKAQPSALSIDGSSFNVTWQHS